MSSNETIFPIGGSIVLRPAAIENAEPLFALVDANRLHLRVWLPWVDGSRQVEDTSAFLARAIESRNAGRGAVWVIEDAGALCGIVGFNSIEPLNRVCEIGYWLGAEHQSQGIMTRCVSRLIQYAFEDVGLNRITISVAVANVRSRAIPERLGFRAEGVMREAEWLYGHFVDHVLYALVRSDWQRK